nr:DNA-directed RNA polymerase IV subunit 1 isoform X1 [Tanacetum cinerariifolium]
KLSRLRKILLVFKRSIRFQVLSEEDAEKASVKEITVPNEVTDPALGFPNPASQCHTCGAKDYRTCEGHIGLIKFPFTILHPYFLPEVAQILNKICPECKNLVIIGILLPKILNKKNHFHHLVRKSLADFGAGES